MMSNVVRLKPKTDNDRLRNMNAIAFLKRCLAKTMPKHRESFIRKRIALLEKRISGQEGK